MGDLTYLSGEWLTAFRAATASLSAAPGISGTIQIEIPDSPAGAVSYVLDLLDGRIIGTRPGSSDKPDLTLRLPYADSIRVQKAEMTYQQAYERGVVSVHGNWTLAIDLSFLTEGEEFSQILQKLDAETVYD